MLLRFSMFALVVVLTGPVSAQSFYSGNDLLRECNAKRAFCTGYVAGVSDGIQLAQNITGTTGVCLPDGVISGQVTDVAIQYLQQNPADRHYAAASTIGVALSKAFPCPKQDSK